MVDHFRSVWGCGCAFREQRVKFRAFIHAGTSWGGGGGVCGVARVAMGVGSLADGVHRRGAVGNRTA